MPATAPAHFFGREPTCFLVRGDGGLGFRIGRQLTIRNQRLRRQRRSLRACGKRETACRKSKGEFQKVPPFHDISSSAIG